jgi:regulatory protein
MKITSVEKSNRKNGQLSIYIDGEYSFSIPEDVYLTLNLYDKEDIDSEQIQYIKDTVVFNAAKAAAIRYLSVKLKTEKEVRQKLKEYRYDNVTIGKVVEELKAMGYINNNLYIQKYLYDRSRMKPKSKKMLRYELQSKGLPVEDIDKVLSEWKIDEYSVAENIIRKKFGKYDLNDETIQKKIYSFLKHRGFDFSVAEEVINRLIEANNGKL